MKLIIAEKPSVATIFAKVLKATNRQDGYIKSDDYIISWCFGHLVEASQPSDYDKKYKEWKIEHLPIVPQKWLYRVTSDKKKQFSILEKLMNSNEVTEVICATDSGREGELIFRLVYNQAKCKKPALRLWTSSLEESAIVKALLNLKNINEFDSLYKSALCREQADWLIGINMSRLFSLLFGTTLSVGRVQTPTLTMIVEREKSIKNFNIETYDQVELSTTSFKALTDRLNTSESETVKSDCTSQVAIVQEVKTELKSETMPRLYDLTTLQRHANKLFGFTAKKTLDIAQSLYESKLITYPRTDSKFITKDMENTALNLFKNILEKIEIVKNLNYEPDINYIIDDSKVSDHFAIIPTSAIFASDLTQLDPDNINILYLIMRRFLASLSSKYTYEKVDVCIKCDKYKFYLTKTNIKDKGFKKVEDCFNDFLGIKREEQISNFEFHENQAINDFKLDILKKNTTPPKRFTEDTLLSMMEDVTKQQYENTETEKKGLGTPATRAAIIEKLITQEFVTRNKKQLVPTDKASLILNLPSYLISPQMTADWETKLQKIESKQYDSNAFNREIEVFIEDIISSQLKIIDEQFNGKTIGKCPNCNANVFERQSQFVCDTCTFSVNKNSIFFTSKKIELNAELMTKFLSEKKIFFEKLYSEKTKKYYKAYLMFDENSFNEKYVSFKLEF